MVIYVISLVVGLILLVWSADRFVESASQLARIYGVSPMMIGMVIIGFGTSAPEIFVSILSSIKGNPGLALGNAYGSNITNISLIIGLTALLLPIQVESKVLRTELPILLGVTLVSMVLLLDYEVSRLDALVLALLFVALFYWTIRQGLRNKRDQLAQEVKAEFPLTPLSPKKVWMWQSIGLVLLISSSYALVYGAVGIATWLGVGEVIIGLTVVAIGTSLPELASCISAAKKGESDMVLGNVLGSNLFNTLAVVSISGLVQPFAFAESIFLRDVSVMALLTVLLFAFGFGFTRQGRINRLEGAIFLACYVGYTAYLISIMTSVEF